MYEQSLTLSGRQIGGKSIWGGGNYFGAGDGGSVFDFTGDGGIFSGDGGGFGGDGGGFGGGDCGGGGGDGGGC